MACGVACGEGVPLASTSWHRRTAPGGEGALARWTNLVALVLRVEIDDLLLDRRLPVDALRQSAHDLVTAHRLHTYAKMSTYIHCNIMHKNINAKTLQTTCVIILYTSIISLSLYNLMFKQPIYGLLQQDVDDVRDPFMALQKELPAIPRHLPAIRL